jgi:hypothetical protein
MAAGDAGLTATTGGAGTGVSGAEDLPVPALPGAVPALPRTLARTLERARAATREKFIAAKDP